MVDRSFLQLMCSYPMDNNTVAYICTQQMAQEEAEKFIEAYEKNVSDAVTILTFIGPGPARASQAHRMIKAAQKNHLDDLKRRSKFSPPCTSGCSFCCHCRVDICKSEADLLVLGIKNSGIMIDWERVQIQARRPETDYFHHIMGKDNRCALLGEDNLCRVYDYRPSACIEHIAASDPSGCDMTKIKDKAYVYVAETRAISTALAMVMEGDTIIDLPTALLERRSEICQDT